MRSFAALTLVLLWSVALLSQQSAPNDTLVYERTGNRWFEEASTDVSVSSDGAWLLFHIGNRNRQVVSTQTGKPDYAAAVKQLGGTCEGLVFSGASPNVPEDATVRCSHDGKSRAYIHPKDPKQLLLIGLVAANRGCPLAGCAPITLPGRITGMVFSPDDSALYVLAFRSDGASSLVRMNTKNGDKKAIATDLDAPPFYSSIAISADGKTLYIPLASAAAPDNRARHVPDADRWLKIYSVDVATGKRAAIISSSGQDNFAPAVVGNDLYWARNVVHSSVALLPAAGGDPAELVNDAQLPMWHPDGKQLSYTIGGWRRADWALNLDSATVSLDSKGQLGTPSIIVAGYHEDFSAAWSPDGRWIAYHSHRSKTPAVDYADPASTDDVYLRRADDLHAPELRLTDFGWETGAAFWSPDGRQLLFSSWEKGKPAIDKLWLLTLDPQTGKVLETKQFPLPADIRSAQWAAWSPDGTEIAIEDNRGGMERTLWRINADGTHLTKLLEYRGTTYGGVDWRRDGQSLVFSGLAGKHMQLFSVPRDGGPARPITHAKGDLLHPRISPDGKWILCTHLQQSQQVWRRPLPTVH